MSLFNKSKSSTSSSSTTTDATITNTDNRVAEAGAVFGGNISVAPVNSPIASLSISSTDQGALKVGSDLALAALDLVKSSETANIAAQQSSISKAYDLSQAARQSETSGAINQFVKYAALTVIAAIVAFALKKRAA